MSKEIWKDINGFENKYQISNLGRVKSLNNGKGFIRERILTNVLDKGYLMVCLCKNSKPKNYRNHRLVAQAFIPNPLNKPQINHINGIRNDNRIENLEWCTGSENMIHAFKTGLQVVPKGKENHMYGTIPKNSKLVLDTQTGIFFNSIKEAAKTFNINHVTLWTQLSGKHKNKTSLIYV